MGMIINPGSDMYEQALATNTHVDKSGWLCYINTVISTQKKYVCVSRPRRFGKTMAANMISAYYDCTTNGPILFKDKKIMQDSSFEVHANKYNVLKINMIDFMTSASSIEEMITNLKEDIIDDIMEEFPDIDFGDKINFTKVIEKLYRNTKRKYVIIIDEWDCVFRRYKTDEIAQRTYLDFLRNWLKDKPYIALGYITGILPIKKYGEHSALNIFYGYSAEAPYESAEYFGFTDDEIKMLCSKFYLDYNECRTWYDGYRLARKTVIDNKLIDVVYEIYNPVSVSRAIDTHEFHNYWNKTETYTALQKYILLNRDGLKDIIIALIAGNEYQINPLKFENDMVTFNSNDDVLTLLVHLGYLSYNSQNSTVRVPNREILCEFKNSIEDSRDWSKIANAMKKSEDLLSALMAGNAEAVAEGIEEAHLETSHLQYNDENALSYTVSLGLYAARNYYDLIRELPTGKGFADLVYIPLPQYADKPAMIVELKWDNKAETAINQIKKKQYVKALENYSGEILLVGISYDKDKAKADRVHHCVIEKVLIDYA